MKSLILELLSKIRLKGSFFRNLTFTFGSNVLSFVLGLLFYPITTKFYSPAAYSEYSVAIMLLNNLTVIAGLGYAESLIIAKSKKEYYQLTSALVILSAFSSVIFCFVFYLLKDLFWSNFKVESFSWIYLVFPLIILSVVGHLYGMANIRFGLLERSAKYSMVLRLLSKALVLGLGYVGVRSGIGIMIGDIFLWSFVAILLLPIKKIILLVREIMRFDFASYISVLRKYIDYPKFVFPTLWIVVLTQQIPLWYIGGNFASEKLGLYTFVLGIARIPIDIINRSVRPVFFQKNMTISTLGDEAIREHINKVVKVFYLLVPAYLISAFWSIEFLYEHLFDEQWIAGKNLMQLVLAGVSITIISSPMASVFKVNNKLRLDLTLRIGILVFLAIVCYLLHVVTSDFMHFVLSYNIFFFIGFYVVFVYQLREFRIKSMEILKITLKFIVILLFSALVTIGLKIQFL